MNGVDLHFERAGEGQHGVLLLPGALGKYAQQRGCAQPESLTLRPLPQGAAGATSDLSWSL